MIHRINSPARLSELSSARIPWTILKEQEKARIQNAPLKTLHLKATLKISLVSP